MIKDNKRKHIVRSFPYDSEGASGWITFACQLVESFQYSVAVKGLTPGTTDDVRAESLATAFVPERSPGAWLPTSYGPGVIYPLDSITTNGEGEITGLVPLPATNNFLPFGLYGWEIKEADSTPTDVLWTMPADPIDLLVFPRWP